MKLGLHIRLSIGLAVSALLTWSSSLAVTLNGVSTYLEYLTGSAQVQNVSLRVRTKATDGIILFEAWSGGEVSF